MTSKYAHHQVNIGDDTTSWSKVARLVPEGCHVLDVGCSTGYLGETLIKYRGSTVAGIELDATDAATARERGLDPVIAGDLESLDWAALGDARFDVIVFADVLEHLRAPERVLERALGVLADGGRVIISVPNIAHLSVRVELMGGNFIYEPVGILDDTHTKYFTRATLFAMLEGVGLHVKHLDATLYDLPEDLIKERLLALGLAVEPAFRKLMQSEEARAYQWVAVADRAPGPIERVPLPEKLVMPHARLVSEHKSQQDQIADFRRRLEQMLSELSAIKGSRTYRTAQGMARIYRTLRRRP